MSSTPSNPADDNATITDIVEAWLQTSPVKNQITHGERPVLLSLVKGLNEADAATQLQLSRHTVHTHVRHLYRKMRVNSRAALISKVISEALSRN